MNFVFHDKHCVNIVSTMKYHLTSIVKGPRKRIFFYKKDVGVLKCKEIGIVEVQAKC